MGKSTTVATKAKATISSTARKMILEGKDNTTVLKALKRLYKIDDSKKHYPAWYRAELVRTGQLKASKSKPTQH